MRERSIVQIRQCVRDGGSAFLFLRTDKLRTRVRSKRGALREGRTELDYLREVVDTAFASDVPVSLVPLALFWRKGARPERPFLNLFYGGNERPTDFGKVVAFLWNYRNLAVRVGQPIDLRAFVDANRASGRERVVKQVRRSLLDLPAPRGEARRRRAAAELRARAGGGARRRRGAARDRRGLERASAARPRASRRARARTWPRSRRRRARPCSRCSRCCVEWLFKRLFARIDVHGLEPVVEAAKLHPLVLVPSHRSHFDYLILSWLFYQNHLVPPQVAAGINLAFWPLGPIFRRAGAFFLRRSFDGDPLYRAVFRSYVQHLIKDGVTQEFFIEGTRSRTGKTLRPRLGMLRMVLEAYARGARRDLYLVPIGFTYERLVEESSITGERGGARKQRESLFSLLRAHTVLRYKYGSVTVRFGEPISLAQHFGDRVPRRTGPGQIPDLRAVTAEFGVEISRRIDALITAGRSAVAAAALLGQPANALREEELRERVIEVARLLELLGVPRSESLERCLASGRPEAAIELLEQAERVKRVASPRGDLIQIADGMRAALDLYRATIGHALVWPARARARPARAARARGAARATRRAGSTCSRDEYFPRRGRGAPRAARARARAPGRARLGRDDGRGGAARRRASASPGSASCARSSSRCSRPTPRSRASWPRRTGRASATRCSIACARCRRRRCSSARRATPRAPARSRRRTRSSCCLREGILIAQAKSDRGEASLAPGPDFGALEPLRARLAAATALR